MAILVLVAETKARDPRVSQRSSRKAQGDKKIPLYINNVIHQKEAISYLCI